MDLNLTISHSPEIGVRDQWHEDPTHSTCQIASDERFKQAEQGARMWQTTDRQTDHDTQKCVAIVGFACMAAIPPNNTIDINNNTCVHEFRITGRKV